MQNNYEKVVIVLAASELIRFGEPWLKILVAKNLVIFWLVSVD